MIPLVERNFNLVELGPRGTGKSFVYREVSPYAILVSGGKTTVANLFYNMATRKMGLVGLWNVVAFDEVAGIHFDDKTAIQILKDYLESGSFSRGREEMPAEASMVFLGNLNQPVEVLTRTRLFDPLPDGMRDDMAFIDRLHFYLPGWELPKMTNDMLTEHYGFVVDYSPDPLAPGSVYCAALTDGEKVALHRIEVSRMVAKVDPIFYPDPPHAALKALGIN